MKPELEAHCRKPGCECQHIICFRGWKNDTDKDTTPCEYCRPMTHARWLKREAARHKGYPNDSLGRIMRGENGQ